MEYAMAKVAGSVFVTKLEEVETAVPSEVGSIVAGDAVHHQDEGPCLVLARIGDNLMLESEVTPSQGSPETNERSI